MTRNWYIAPRLIVEEDLVAEVKAYSGPGSGGSIVDIPGMVCMAYQADDVLVGLIPGSDAPDDWTAQTVDEARTHLETVHGRSANPGEVT